MNHHSSQPSRSHQIGRMADDRHPKDPNKGHRLIQTSSSLSTRTITCQATTLRGAHIAVPRLQEEAWAHLELDLMEDTHEMAWQAHRGNGHLQALFLRHRYLLRDFLLHLVFVKCYAYTSYDCVNWIDGQTVFQRTSTYYFD